MSDKLSLSDITKYIKSLIDFDQIKTTKVYTEREMPEMGQIVRRQPSVNEGTKAVVNFFKEQL